MATKKEIANFKKLYIENDGPDTFTNKYLSRRLWQYRKIRTGRNKSIGTLVDVYKEILLFQKEIVNTIVNIEKEIINAVQGKEMDIILPNRGIKFVIKKIREKEDIDVDNFPFSITEETLTTTKDWNRAIAQHKKPLE